MKLAHIADQVAADIYTRPIHPTRSQASVILDACDTATGGALSPKALDRLVDMVERRLAKPPSAVDDPAWQKWRRERD